MGTVTPFEIALLYFAGVVQGLALVTFPAASGILTSPSGFALSATEYGSMFIPQVVMAIGASALGSRIASRRSLRFVLLLGLCGDLASMSLLAMSALVIGTSLAYVMLCVATGALGLGFGATVMSLNTMVEGFFRERADSAVLVLNALLGVGTALAPVLVAVALHIGAWWALPVLMTVLSAGLIVGVLRAKLQLPYDPAAGGGKLPHRFWLYAMAITLYGVLETLNGNWATLYLASERGATAQNASFALTAFWVMVTVGRIVVAFLDRIVPARWIYVALPLLLAVAFQTVAHANSGTAGIIAFGAAGLACSAFLPFSISFAGSEFPRQAATMSGALLAFYQAGYGIAAFGVGPLRQLAALEFQSLYGWASTAALALAATALLVIRHPRAGNVDAAQPHA